MRAIIIDDEDHCITTLKWDLNKYCPEVEIIGAASDGEKGLVLISELKPDLIFLDVEMPRLNGIDMLARLGTLDFKVIFTTAYDKYAIKAFKLSAIDYLLKPIDKDELMHAIDKVDNLNVKNREQQIETIKHNLNLKSEFKKIVIPTSEGLLFFDVNDIINLEAQSNYSYIYFKDNTKLLSSKNLKEFEDTLPEDIFFRCHHSHLINMNYIKKYIKGEGGIIILSNEREVEVSRRKKNDFLDRIR
ncbi:MAG: LytTR family DNA-binding domain-containing protein [Saprospiraceae bacterium]